jgi:hypothetical protein
MGLPWVTMGQSWQISTGKSNRGSPTPFDGLLAPAPYPVSRTTSAKKYNLSTITVVAGFFSRLTDIRAALTPLFEALTQPLDPKGIYQLRRMCSGIATANQSSRS